MAEYVATQRQVGAVLMLSGALPLDVIGATAWPSDVPAQIHYTIDDPFRRQDGIDALVAQIRASGSPVEVFDYDGPGHLFTDPSRAEYQPAEAEVLWRRVLAFCKNPSSPGRQ